MARISPATYTLRIPQRATLEEPMTLKAGAPPVAMNLTGYTVLAQIWRDERRRVKLADLTVTYVNRSLGQIRLSLTRSQTRLLDRGGFWDLLVIEPSGAADYWLEGPAVLDVGLTDDVA
jgi:hypothetical protein